MGKSCFAMRAVRDRFDENQEPTIGAAYLAHSVALEDCTVKFELWDTAGQERYRSLAPMYYRGAGAAIVVFDVSNLETFNGAKRWIAELRTKGEPGAILALVGNKLDKGYASGLDSEMVQEYARSMNITFTETSAKTGAGIREVFNSIARALPKSQAAVSKVSLEPSSSGGGGCC